MWVFSSLLDLAHEVSSYCEGLQSPLYNYRPSQLPTLVLCNLCIAWKSHFSIGTQAIGTQAASKTLSVAASRSSPLRFSGSSTMSTHSCLVYCSCSANLHSICSNLVSKSYVTSRFLRIVKRNLKLKLKNTVIKFFVLKFFIYIYVFIYFSYIYFYIFIYFHFSSLPVWIYLYIPSSAVTLNSGAQPLAFFFCPWPLTFFFCPNDNFQTNKFDVLRQSFDGKLLSPNVSGDVQKHLFDLCVSQIVTVLAGEIWINFSTYN